MTKLNYLQRRKLVKAYWKDLQTRKTGLKIPNRKQWMAAVRSGLNPDGCTMCPDTIWGVVIGCSSTDWKAAMLPCNCHDYLFHIGGTEEDFQKANIFFYQLLRERVKKVRWPFRRFARTRCDLIYQAVSGPLARSHFNFKPVPGSKGSRAGGRSPRSRR
jgi:hypothetical protein